MKIALLASIGKWLLDRFGGQRSEQFQSTNLSASPRLSNIAPVTNVAIGNLTLNVAKEHAADALKAVAESFQIPDTKVKPFLQIINDSSSIPQVIYNSGSIMRATADATGKSVSEIEKIAQPKMQQLLGLSDSYNCQMCGNPVLVLADDEILPDKCPKCGSKMQYDN
jgi:rubrerythrin